MSNLVLRPRRDPPVRIRFWRQIAEWSRSRCCVSSCHRAGSPAAVSSYANRSEFYPDQHPGRGQALEEGGKEVSRHASRRGGMEQGPAGPYPRARLRPLLCVLLVRIAEKLRYQIAVLI